MKKKELKQIIDDLQNEITQFQFYCKKQERAIHNLEVKNKYLQKNTECGNCHSNNVKNENLKRSNENLTKTVVEKEEECKKLNNINRTLSSSYENTKRKLRKTEDDRDNILNDLCKLLLLDTTAQSIEAIELLKKKYRFRVRDYLKNEKAKSEKPTRKPRKNAITANISTIRT